MIMIKPKIYIAKAIKGADGMFVAEEGVEISDYFKGVYYKKTEGLEAYGKPRTYIEEFPEASTPNIFFSNRLETSDFTLVLYFFDIAEHKDDAESIKAIDELYHGFVDYITGTFIKYWDSVRQRKVMLAYQASTSPTTDRLYGLIYKEVGFKFTNLYGKSFPLDSTVF